MSNVEQRADADLLVALPHDLGAFEAFYERYVDRVTAFAARRCSCAEDVADVVAQTFVRLLEVADRSDPTRGDPGPFVFGIAVNAARDLHRRGSRQRAIASKLVGTSWQACVSPGPSPPGPTTATPMARATGGTNQRNGSRAGWRPILLSCLGVT
jgi:RNA polymerase sigma factor (sigma-70 family)